MTSILAVEWSQGIEDAWADVASFVPKFLGFLVILIVGYFIAKAISKAASAILERVGFDRAVERGGIKRALERSKYDASDILGKVVFYALFLIVLQMAFGVFGPNPISDLLEGVIAYLPKVIAAILIIVVASAIGAAARELVDASLGGLSYGPALANGIGIAIVVIGIFAALNQLQIAPAIVTGLFYALLAIVVGSAVIAIGGGGIVPMRARWQNALAKYDAEKPQVQQAARGSKERIAARAQQRADEARSLQQASDSGASSPRMHTPNTEPSRSTIDLNREGPAT
jgi:Conserved TM helix